MPYTGTRQTEIDLYKAKGNVTIAYIPYFLYASHKTVTRKNYSRQSFKYIVWYCGSFFFFEISHNFDILSKINQNNTITEPKW